MSLTNDAPEVKDVKVEIAAEDTKNYNLKVGDEVYLGFDHGRLVMTDENNRIMPAELVSNMKPEDADKFVDIRVKFKITAVDQNVLKAEMATPYSYVHHGSDDWKPVNDED